MTQRVYLAGICGFEGSYGIVFPDFFGCVSAGDTIEQALRMGREALQLHVDGMVEDGEVLPSPTPVDFARLTREFSDDSDPNDIEPWVAVSAIEVDVPAFKNTVPVLIDTGLVQEVDRAVSNRRQFIMDATRRELERLKKSA